MKREYLLQISRIFLAGKPGLLSIQGRSTATTAMNVPSTALGIVTYSYVIFGTSAIVYITGFLWVIFYYCISFSRVRILHYSSLHFLLCAAHSFAYNNNSILIIDLEVK